MLRRAARGGERADGRIDFLVRAAASSTRGKPRRCFKAWTRSARVQIFVDEGGAISGVVEQVRTIRDEPILAIEDVSRVIAVMAAGERTLG